MLARARAARARRGQEEYTADGGLNGFWADKFEKPTYAQLDERLPGNDGSTVIPLGGTEGARARVRARAAPRNHTMML